MQKKFKFIFLIILFFILAGSLFIISKKLFTGSVSDDDKTDYSSVTMGDPSDKDCFRLRNGQLACKVGTIKISPGEIFEDSFKIKN